MPPRHGKSEICSHYFPAWFLSRFPRREVMLASYAENFAVEWGLKVRQTIEAHPELNVRLNRSSKAAGLWKTEQGGAMFAAGVGGGQTGRGSHFSVIDDPIKNLTEAYSATTRESHKGWYRSSARTRLAPGGSIVLPMTRWHEDDLAGWLLREASKGGEQWTEIRFPAIATADDVLGRKPGEALWPERYPLEELAKIQQALGGPDSLVWSALYQQDPHPAGNALFPPRFFRHYPIAPAPSFFDRLFVSVDATFKDRRKSDFVVLQLWGIKGARAFLLEQVRDQMDFTRTIAEMRGLRERWLGAISAWYIEEAANGPAIISHLEAEIPGIVGVQAVGGKEARAAAVQPFVQAGNVWLPSPDHAPWVPAFLEECRTFPASTNDDQVDAMSQALSQAWLTGAVTAGNVDLGMAGLLSQSRWRNT